MRGLWELVVMLYLALRVVVHDEEKNACLRGSAMSDAEVALRPPCRPAKLLVCAQEIFAYAIAAPLARFDVVCQHPR